MEPSTPPSGGLTLDLSVTVTRRRRAKCPRCGNRRVLVALDAFSTGQPVGYGEARCLECAGMRERAGR